MVPVFATPEVMPIDLPQLVAISLSLMLFIIPVLGATVRWAIKPVLEALLQAGVIGPASRTQLPAGDDKPVERLERRVLELEQELNKVKALSGALPAHSAVDPLAAGGGVSDPRRVR
jgi:hypothetical protein